MRKAFAIICTIIIICSLIVIPTFAIGVTVESNGWNDIGFSRDIEFTAPTNYSDAVNEGYFSVAQTETVIEIANEMYKANAFNGTRPVLITLTRSETGFYILFWCNAQNLQAPSYNQIYVTPNADKTNNRILNFTLLTDEYNNQTLTSYAIRLNGSNYKTPIPTAQPVKISPYYETSNSIQATWYYAYFNGYEWVYNENDGFCVIANNDENTNNQPVEEFQYALDQWKNANKGTTEVNPNITYQYQLDIPGIITAIPNGAKQIINNAFGFEIFGINVAGLLSVLLIVTIVAFVVKWLMNR